MTKVCSAMLMIGLGMSCLLAGCSSSSGPKGKATPVQGTIKMDGTPLVRVRVEFVPVNPTDKLPASSAVTDENGHYVLKTGDGRDGAIVGKHYVTLHSERDDERSRKPGSPRPVPPPYELADAQNPLGVVDITEGKQEYDFVVKSK